MDTDPDEAPASPAPAPAPARAEEGHRSERAPRKRKWDERPEDRQPEAPAAPTRSRPTHELLSRPKQRARKMVLPTSSEETGRTPVRRSVLPTQEEIIAQVLGRSVNPSTQKARMPSEEDRRTDSRPTASRATEGRPTAGRQEQRVQPDNRPEAEESLAEEPTTLRESSSAEDASEKTPPAKRPSGVKTCRVDPTAGRTTASTLR